MLYHNKYTMGKRLSAAGQLTFNDVMKMFRDELLDLNAILNYIKLAPDESAAATFVVSLLQDICLCLDATWHKLDRAASMSEC